MRSNIRLRYLTQSARNALKDNALKDNALKDNALKDVVLQIAMRIVGHEHNTVFIAAKMIFWAKDPTR